MLNRMLSKVAVIGVSMAAGAALTLLLQSSPHLAGFASAADSPDPTVPEAWSLESLATMELEERPDIDWTPIESGTARNTETIIYEGENVVLVWEAGPAKLITGMPFPYDEFIIVLKGTLILTDQDGNSATYKEGDSFVVPKGFMGTWDMPEVFRELVVIKADEYNREP